MDHVEVSDGSPMRHVGKWLTLHETHEIAKKKTVLHVYLFITFIFLQYEDLVKQKKLNDIDKT